MRESEFHDFIRRLLDEIQGEKSELTKAALTALYEMTRLALYVKKKDRVGYSEKTIYAAGAFAKLTEMLEDNLKVPRGTVAKKLR